MPSASDYKGKGGVKFIRVRGKAVPIRAKKGTSGISSLHPSDKATIQVIGAASRALSHGVGFTLAGFAMDRGSNWLKSKGTAITTTNLTSALRSRINSRKLGTVDHSMRYARKARKGASLIRNGVMLGSVSRQLKAVGGALVLGSAVTTFGFSAWKSITKPRRK